MKRLVYVQAARRIDIYKDDINWMQGLRWDWNGHDFKITGLNDWNKSCLVTETWVSEDTWEDRSNEEWFNIKQDNNGAVYIQSRKHPEFKLYANAAYNYEYQVPVQFNEYDIDEDLDDEIESLYDEGKYTPSASRGDYSPSNPWDAPGMSISDFI